MIDLSKISTNNKTLFLAYDQGMEHGPSDFNDDNIDPNYILKIGIEAGFNAIIFQKGVAEKYYFSTELGTSIKEKLPLVIKLNGKTSLITEQDPYSPLLCTVDEAISLGAVGVGYTVYVGSEHESKMTQEVAGVVRDAHAKNIPVIGWMYPRGKATQGKSKQELICYAARVGLELGCDIVKVNYPGSVDDLKHTVEAAGKTKVVSSGGAKEDEAAFLQLAKDVVAAGAFGMAVGRNIWQHENPVELSKKLKEVVFAK
jgi:class I fructose-bisphosphate aldolase